MASQIDSLEHLAPWPEASRPAGPEPWRDHDERRARILAAARRLLRDRPFEAVSGREIAMAAGVSMGMLGRCFETRRDLYLALVEDVLSARWHAMSQVRRCATGCPRASRDGWNWRRVTRGCCWRRPARAAPGMTRGSTRSWRRPGTGRSTRWPRSSASANSPTPVRRSVRCYSGLVEAVGREWLQGGCLSPEQIRVLMEEALPALVERVLPPVLEAGRPE